MTEVQLLPDDVSLYAHDLTHLQRAAFAVEAVLIQDDRIPPLWETADDLVQARLHWYVTVEDERIIGAVGYRVDDGLVDIDRLIVHPDHHRRGIGRSLVLHTIAAAREAVVSTGRDNAPARRLYEEVGFVHVADREVAPGLIVSDYFMADQRASN